MKKFMIAAAVAAVAGATFADVSSANTVGYINTAIRSGYTLFVPQFDEVGSTGLDIQKIKPNTEATGIFLQTFTALAEGETGYYYVPAGKAGAGWYTAAAGRANQWASKTFAKGEGFMVFMPSSDISLNISGEVNTNAYTLTSVRSGYTLMGNFRPMSYDIQKIVPATESTGVFLQTFTALAEGETGYYYVPAGKAGAGWYTAAAGRANQWASKTFTPGEGFMIYLPSSMNVTFQAAE